MPPRIGASIEAARLVLKEPDLWIPRALKLAVRPLGPEPKTKPKSQKPR